jgi:uncharacterized membrane protein YhhN
MTTTAWVLLAAAAVLAVADWVAVTREHKPTEYVCKPGTLLLLMGVALALDPADEAQRAWFVAALVLSLAGDVFLMLPRDAFVPGLASFLLGHLAYIVGLRLEGEGGGLVALGVAAVAVGVVTAVVGGRVLDALRAGQQDKLRTPVVAYMAVISTMVVCAVATGDVRAAVGAGLFYASDAMIAWNRFVEPLPYARPAIMSTYHLAQAGLILSLLPR